MAEFKEKENRQSELSIAASLFESDVDESDEHELFIDYHENKLDLDTSMISIEDLYPAPDEWNQWTRLSRVQMFELMDSISEIGLQHNIVVWKKDDDNKFMILAGHNRVEAFKELYALTSDPKYLKIRALISNIAEMDETIAKRVIDDTNAIGRTVTPKEKARAIMNRYTELNKEYMNVSEKKLLSMIGSEENKDYKQIKRYFDLNKLIPEIQILIGDELSIKAGQKLSLYNESVQKSIYEEFYLTEENKEFFTNRSIEKLREYMSYDKIRATMLNLKQEFEYIDMQIPSEIKKDVDALIKKWKKHNGL